MNIPIRFLGNRLNDKDAVMREQIIRVLHNRDLSAFKNLEVESIDGVVTLRGSTRSFYDRQIALTYTKAVVGDCPMVDEIVVQDK